MAVSTLVVLISCNTVDTPTVTAPVAARSPQPVSPVQSPVSSLNATSDIKATAFFQAQTATESAVAPFPRICKDPFSIREFSPNGLWMTELCDSREDDSLIMTLSNRETHELWKLVYREYTQRAGILWDEGFAVVYWSNDNRYAYVRLFFHGDGGECFVGMKSGQDGKGLLRLDLQTGSIVTILPTGEDTNYGFSFAPTGRRLVYETYSTGLKILDIQTGQLIDVDPARQFDIGGNYIWSPDGLQFVYSNVSYTDQWAVLNYSLRMVDGKTGSEQILLESPKNCFAVRNWKDNHVIVVESFDPKREVTVMEYDLNLKRILSEGTATPAPK
jgi:hypothetical protein